MSAAVRLAVTMGDPAGIGPEILGMAARLRRDPAIELVAVGDAVSLAGAGVPIHVAAERRDQAPVGRPSAEGGRLAFAAVAEAIRLAVDGEVDGIVTGPISKEAINLAGHAYAGHTEILADLTGHPGSVMMLAHGELRVTHVTTHVPLARVPSLLTRDRLARVLDLTLAALADLEVARPRIAVCGLNPHAGENGLFGAEDGDLIAPVVEAYRSSGHDVSGPHSGDTVFVKAAARQFDAVVAMYHDQGHIPVKLLGFSVDRATGRWTGLSGVNVTLGLPIIRTSVDHGTAFDIAGRGLANPQSLVEAIDYAARLVRGRRARR